MQSTSKGSDQTDLILCWSHITHCWKSHALAQIQCSGIDLHNNLEMSIPVTPYNK